MKTDTLPRGNTRDSKDKIPTTGCEPLPAFQFQTGKVNGRRCVKRCELAIEQHILDGFDEWSKARGSVSRSAMIERVLERFLGFDARERETFVADSYATIHIERDHPRPFKYSRRV